MVMGSSPIAETLIVNYLKIGKNVFRRTNSISENNSKSLYSVQIHENTDQKKLRIWTLFTQWWY